MSPLQLILILHILTLSICQLTCLPITSKPIENTPEHLAWEAWIMVPQPEDKTRKITPKSIFILPNKTNGGTGSSSSNNGGYGGATAAQQIQCPPGHRVDNFRCIPTVLIDRDQLLLTQLTNLLPTDKYNINDGNVNDTNYNYDYDYDYTDGYDPDAAESLIPDEGRLPPDYNGEPLKINLSLGKFPTTTHDNDNNKDGNGNFGLIEDVPDDVDNYEDELKVQPFRGEKTSSSTISTTATSTSSKATIIPTTTTTTTTKTTITATPPPPIPPRSTTTTTSSTTNNPRTTTPSTTTITPTTTTTTTTPRTKIISFETEQQSEKSIKTTIPDVDLSDSSHISEKHPTTSTPFYTTTPSILILSPSEAEISRIIIKNKTTTTEPLDYYDYSLNEQSTLRTTADANDDDEMDLITESVEMKTDLKDDLIEESLVFDKETVTEPNTTETEDSTEIELIITTTPTKTTTTTNNINPTDGINKQAEIINDLLIKTSGTKKFEETNLPPKQNDTIEKSENKTHTQLKLPATNEHNLPGFDRNHNQPMIMSSTTIRTNSTPKKHHETIQLQEDNEPILDSIESNNRFVYHHLGSNSHNRRPDQNQQQHKHNHHNNHNPTSFQYPPHHQVESTTPNIQEQLRIINRIVEENKRRSQQHHHHARIRFPTDSEEQMERERERFRDFIRYPDSSSSSQSQPAHLPAGSSLPFGYRLEPYYKKYSDIMKHPSTAILPPLLSPSSPPSTSGELEQQQQQQLQKDQKPFWWAPPNDWEIDRRNGDRPLLVKFWSRAPHEQEGTPEVINNNSRQRTAVPSSSSSSSSSISTSGYRENSRSPTENLYKEISAQEVYKVLGAKQWKHNNR